MVDGWADGPNGGTPPPVRVALRHGSTERRDASGRGHRDRAGAHPGFAYTRTSSKTGTAEQPLWVAFVVGDLTTVGADDRGRARRLALPVGRVTSPKRVADGFRLVSGRRVAENA
jgi:hypothetical protein